MSGQKWYDFSFTHVICERVPAGNKRLPWSWAWKLSCLKLTCGLTSQYSNILPNSEQSTIYIHLYLSIYLYIYIHISIRFHFISRWFSHQDSGPLRYHAWCLCLTHAGKATMILKDCQPGGEQHTAHLGSEAADSQHTGFVGCSYTWL